MHRAHVERAIGRAGPLVAVALAVAATAALAQPLARRPADPPPSADSHGRGPPHGRGAMAPRSGRGRARGLAAWGIARGDRRSTGAGPLLRRRPEAGASRPVGTVPGDPVLVGAGDIGSCTSPGDEATGALVAATPGTVFTRGRCRLPVRHGRGLRALLRTKLGLGTAAHPADARQSRVRDRRAPPATSPTSAPRPATGARAGTPTTSARGASTRSTATATTSAAAAAARAQERWLAPTWPRTRAVRRGDLASPALQLGRARQRPSTRPCGGRSTTPAPTWSSPATITSTSASRRQTRRVAPTRQAPASSSSAPAGQRCGGLRTIQPHSQVRKAHVFGVLKLVPAATGLRVAVPRDARNHLHRHGTAACR